MADPKDDPNWPLPSFDARDWAEAFCKRFAVCEPNGLVVDDAEGLMTTWFATALMRGWDEHAGRIAALNDEQRLLLTTWFGWKADPVEVFYRKLIAAAGGG